MEMVTRNGIEVPQHLNEDYFQNVLATNLNLKDLKLKKLTFKMGSAPGDNYASKIYRVEIDYNCDNNKIDANTSLIVKNMGVHAHIDVVADILDAHRKEVTAYTKVIPIVEKIVGDTKFAPKFLAAIGKPECSIVFEDLSKDGYRTCDREIGGDLNHCKLVMEKLGKYHAATMILVKEKPKVIDEFMTGIFTREMFKSETFNNFFHGNMKAFLDNFKTWPGFESIYPKLECIYKNFDQRILDNVAPQEGEILVLNHGDLWLNNMMFKYDKNNNSVPENVIFIDYQVGFYASPGIDINYFLNSSVQLDVLRTKRDELISLYYNSLRTTLKKCRYTEPIPTEEQIRNEIRAKEYYGFITSVTIFPIIGMDREECKDNNLDMFTDKEKMHEKQNIMFSSKRCIDTLRYSIKRFDELKVFD